MAAALDPGACDAMLINAGVTHPHAGVARCPARGWPHDRPLTIAIGKTLGKGVMAKITRQGACLAARVVTFVVIIHGASVRDSSSSTLGKAMGTGALMKMQSVAAIRTPRKTPVSVHGAEVCLSPQAQSQLTTIIVTALPR